MDCLLTVLQLCLFNPANIYLSANVDYAFEMRQGTEESFTTLDADGHPFQVLTIRDRSFVARDHARITLGWTVYESRALSFDLGLVHGSSPSVRDVGYEGAFAGFTWRPFK